MRYERTVKKDGNKEEENVNKGMKERNVNERTEGNKNTRQEKRKINNKEKSKNSFFFFFFL
jgi:hypothetical protein